MSLSKEILKLVGEEESMYNIVVVRNGKESIFNKKPMNKKDAEDMLQDIESSGVEYDSIDMQRVGEAVDDAISQIRTLSSGTMATITGFNKHQILDQIQKEWLLWEMKSTKKHKTWQESWAAWMKALGVEMRGNKANSDDLYRLFPLNIA